MRTLGRLSLIGLAALLQSAAPAFAQQSVYSPPRELSSRANAQAKPIGGAAGYPAAHSSDPQFPVRMAAAEEPRPLPASATAGLKLSPRSSGSERRLDRPVGPSAGGAVGTVAGSLGIVLGLFLVLAWCSRRFAPAGSAQLPKEVVELLGRSSLSPRQQVQLVRIGNKLLLVATTTAGAETLTEITDPVEVERLAALCRRGQAASATSSFNQVLGQLAREPVPGLASQPHSRTRGAS